MKNHMFGNKKRLIAPDEQQVYCYKIKQEFLLFVSSYMKQSVQLDLIAAIYNYIKIYTQI